MAVSICNSLCCYIKHVIYLEIKKILGFKNSSIKVFQNFNKLLKILKTDTISSYQAMKNIQPLIDKLKLIHP